MKNVCVALRKNLNVSPHSGLNAVIDELFLSGYSFEEIRILSIADDLYKATLSSLKKDCENVFFLTEKALLAEVNSALKTEFPTAKLCAEFDGEAIFDDGKSTVFLLSQDETGVQYVKNACVPFLQEKYGDFYDKLVIRTVGTNASHLEDLLRETNRRFDNRLLYKHERKYDEEVIEIVCNGSFSKTLKEDVLRTLTGGLGESVYALENVSLEGVLVSLLKKQGKKLSVAESFTGGGVARRIVSVSGASEVYFEGLNTYAEDSKIKRLGVSAQTLEKEGAVSEKTAYEMALGLLNTKDCEIAIATTGLAGPKSDRSGLPVGYCCIAVGTKEEICVHPYRFDGSREEITEKAINYALFLACKRLKKV